MVLKVKEFDNKCLILDITKGVYEIKVQQQYKALGPYLKSMLTVGEETLECYDACDYTLKEMIEKLDEMEKLLKS